MQSQKERNQIILGSKLGEELPSTLPSDSMAAAETPWPATAMVSSRLLSSHNNRYPIADAIEKIGKYIAITMNPTVTPRNTIIIGSNNAVRFVTAASTSSS